MNKQAFFRNTAVMTASSLLLRLFGILFRIFISNRVGAEGMGLYQLVFSVYVLGATFATGGIVTAVTRLAAEHLAKSDRAALERLMRISSLLCLLVGGVSALALWAGAPLIGGWIGDARAVPAVAVSGIALPFIGVSSCIKGYFMARRRAWPPCLSQILEQAVRIGGILGMLGTLWDGSLTQACVIIILGDALSETVACLYLLGAYRRDVRRQPIPQDLAPGRKCKLLQPLLYIAVPLTAGRYLSTGLRTVENILVPARLTLYTRSDALSLAQFGAVKGMALPLIFFPSALLMTLSSLLIPELSDAHALKQGRQVTRLVERALHVTLLGSVLVGGLFTVLGQRLGTLLYNDPLVGLLLQILGPLTPVMYLDSVVTGMLKGLGQQVHSLWFSVADSGVRIALIWFLLPRYGLVGFLFVMLVSNLLTATLSTGRLLAVSHTDMQWGRWLVRPGLAAVAAGFLCRLVPARSDIAYVLIAGGLFTLLYGLLLPVLRCFSREDLRQLTLRKA
ncbi:MAG: polysaccharide biosynthesis protein [Clostridia bacterium]|nr:polysaccharide biosynthesis protein [Clostridia bacterium]